MNGLPECYQRAQRTVLCHGYFALPVGGLFLSLDALECFASALHCLQRVILCQGFYRVTELLSCLKIPLHALSWFPL